MVKQKQFDYAYAMYRMTLDTDSRTLSGEVYRSTKKLWKPQFVFNMNEFIMYNNGGGQINALTEKNLPEQYAYMTCDEMVQEWMQLLAEYYPETKWAIKKFSGLRCLLTDVIWYFRFRDIKETETLIDITRKDSHWDNNDRDFNILCCLNTNWRRWSPAFRRKVINNTRKWMKEAGGFYGITLKRLSEYGDKATPNKMARIYGWDDHVIYQYDRDWLEAHREQWEGRFKTTQEAVEHFHDFIVGWKDEPGVTDITDDYFRHRKDWVQIHDALIERDNNRRRLNGLRIFLGLPEVDYGEGPAKEKFRERYAQWTDREIYIGDLHVYVSNSFEVWERRAKALRQCIISSRYYSRQSCVIVFIDRNNEPVATAEIELPSNTLGQFYGYEGRDPEVTIPRYPDAECQEAIRMYMETYTF